MAFENSAGLGVFNQYGTRGTQDGVVSGGELHGVGGAVFEHVVYVTGDDFNGTANYNTRLTVPAGSFLDEAIFEITEVFTVGNIDNVINIGTDTSEVTNGVAIADPETAEVTVDTTGAGTWAAALASDTLVGVSVTGTTPSIAAGSGAAKVILRFRKV